MNKRKKKKHFVTKQCVKHYSDLKQPCYSLTDNKKWDKNRYKTPKQIMEELREILTWKNTK